MSRLIATVARRGDDDIASPERRYSWLLESALPLAVFGVMLVVVVTQIAMKVLDLDWTEFSEGPSLAMAARWTATQPSLAWLTGLPHTPSPYGPAYAWLVSHLLTAFPAAHPLLLGRAVSVVAALVVVVVIARAIRDDGGTGLDASLGLFLFLTAPLVTRFWWQARIDPLAVSCTMTAYAVAAVPGGPWLSAVCLVAGSLVKQNVAIHAVPLAVWFLARPGRHRREFWTFVAVGGCAALVAWVPVLAAFDGYFWQSAVRFHGLKLWRPWHGYTIVYSFLPTAFMTAAMLAAARALLTRGLVSSLADRWWLGFTFSLIVDSALTLKEGSYTHYALTSAAFASVVIARHARDLVGLPQRLAPAGLAIASVIVAFPMVMSLRATPWPRPPSQRQEYVNAVVRVAGHPRTALCDAELTPYLIGASVTPLVGDPFTLTVLSETGHLDLAPLVGDLRHGRIDPVLLIHTIDYHRSVLGTSFRLWPPAVLDALADRYEEVNGLNGVHVFRPRRAQGPNVVPGKPEK